MADTPPTGADNADRVRWWFACIDRHDVSGIRELFAEDAVQRFPDRETHGPDETAAYFGELFTALPDLRMEVVALAAEEDRVFVRWRLTGTHQGVFAGIDPTGRSVGLDGIDHFELRDGKVVSNVVVFDQMQVARALGLLPADGSPADRAMKSAFNVKTRLAELVRSR